MKIANKLSLSQAEQLRCNGDTARSIGDVHNYIPVVLGINFDRRVRLGSCRTANHKRHIDFQTLHLTSNMYHFV